MITAPSRVRVQQALVQSEHYREISDFELQMLPDPVHGAQDESALKDIRRIAGEAFVATSDALVHAPDSEPRIFNARLAAEQLRSEIQHVAATTP
jgi:hypothetical protein